MKYIARKTLLEIQRQILQDTDSETVVVHKSANNSSFNPQRRSALKTIAATTLLTTASNPLIELLNATFGKTLLQPSEAKAQYNYDNIPPGIATCRDKAIEQAFVLARDPNSFYNSVRQIAIFEGILGITDESYYPTEFMTVKNDTPYIEPAYWFLCAMENDYSYKTNQKLKEKNPILFDFSRGIIDYFHEFIYSGYPDLKTEDNLLKAIFGAAGYDKEKKLKEYHDGDFKEKTRIIKATAKSLLNLKVDPKLNQINDNYDKRLIAQWSSLFLTAYYRMTYSEKERNGNLINNFIEKPLRKIDPRVRGYKKGSYSNTYGTLF